MSIHLCSYKVIYNLSRRMRWRETAHTVGSVEPRTIKVLATDGVSTARSAIRPAGRSSVQTLSWVGDLERDRLFVYTISHHFVILNL